LLHKSVKRIYKGFLMCNGIYEMNVDHLKIIGIWWKGTAVTECYGEHGNERACCIRGREFDM